MMGNTEKILTSVLEILKHIKEVQIDVKELSKDSIMSISNFLDEQKIGLNTEVMEALQHQDIISQQLSAIVDAINSVEKNITVYIHALKEDTGMISDGLEKLNSKLSKSLDEAKLKKSSFGGKALNENAQEEIEFF